MAKRNNKMKAMTTAIQIIAWIYTAAAAFLAGMYYQWNKDHPDGGGSATPT